MAFRAYRNYISALLDSPTKRKIFRLWSVHYLCYLKNERLQDLIRGYNSCIRNYVLPMNREEVISRSGRWRGQTRHYSKATTSKAPGFYLRAANTTQLFITGAYFLTSTGFKPALPSRVSHWGPVRSLPPKRVSICRSSPAGHT